MQQVRRLIFVSVCFAVIATVAFVGVFCASLSVPEFYKRALVQDPHFADQAGDELEQELVRMASEVNDGSAWQLVITDQQVNGWLASDMREKFPSLLPEHVSEPRVAFQDQVVCIACRLDTGRRASVLSLKLEAYLTEQPNEFAVHMRQVRAGRVPVPLTRILDHVTGAARQSGVSLRWTQHNGDPVALISLPAEPPELRPGVVIEQLQVGHGTLTVSGTSDAPDDQSRVAESNDEASKNQL